MVADLPDDFESMALQVSAHDKILYFKNLSIPFTITDAGYYVKHASPGDLATSDTYSATGYVDLKGFSQIKYKQACTTSSTSVAGVAFYEEDHTYISGV